jgi:hypothetical protein
MMQFNEYSLNLSSSRNALGRREKGGLTNRHFCFDTDDTDVALCDPDWRI